MLASAMPNVRDDFAIRHVASLARLRLTEHEEVLYAKQLGDILAYATDVLRVDAASPASTPTTCALPTPLRDDRVTSSVPSATVLESAPDRSPDGRLFRVPRVIG
jgi:aspartyl-tRNA(Asn)/glutamyl-tRNA(Gln) amidotransferase subunit C